MCVTLLVRVTVVTWLSFLAYMKGQFLYIEEKYNMLGFISACGTDILGIKNMKKSLEN